MAPKIVSPRRQLILSDEAKRELAQHGERTIEGYLAGLSQQVSIYNEDFDRVVEGAIRERGLPISTEAAEGLVEECAVVAAALTRHKLRNYHQQVKALVAEMGVQNIPPETLWTARRVGVDLLPTPAEPEPH